MPVVTVNLIGRFGNQAMQWLFARAYAERHGHDFQCDPWIGQHVFDLKDTPISRHDLPGRSEFTVQGGEGDVCFRDFYAQSQRAMIYSKSQAQGWLSLGGVAAALKRNPLVPRNTMAHLRRGDYITHGYPVVSRKSYYTACHKFGLDHVEMDFCSEESPRGGLDRAHRHIDFIVDFLALMTAPNLLRSNSSFSWLAGLLGEGRVFSPVIDGLGAGEHDVEFVEGNHPRFCNLDFVTDLQLPR